MRHILVIALAALAAACSGGGGGGDERPAAPTGPSNPGNPANPGSPAAPPQTASVDMRSIEEGGGIYGGGTYSHSFAPSQVTVARGGSVAWTNNTGFTHSVVFSQATGAPSDIPAFTEGVASRTFQTAGTFSYHCSQHSGMNGTVVVQ